MPSDDASGSGSTAAEVSRLVGLGASVADRDSRPARPDFVVMADPGGNLFCVVDLSRAPSTD